MHPILFKRKKIKVPEFLTEVRLSEILPSGFVESGVELDNPVIGTDAHGIVQNILNQSSDDRKVVIHWDRNIAISDTLRIGSNTDIIAADGKGVVLMNAVSQPVFKNRNHRPSNNITIIDHDINILGRFVVNGNNSNQQRGKTGQGMAAGVAWHGVKNLMMDGIRIWNHRLYAQIATNVVNGTMRNFESDFGAWADYNMDGVHWDGWCKNCLFENGRVKSNDDAFVCNADDGYSKWAGFAANIGMLDGFYNESFNGPSSGLKMKNITVDNSTTSHGYGVRILSASSRVDDVVLEDIKGVATNYLVLIDSYAWFDGAMDYEGVGNIGTVRVDNVSGTIKANPENAIPSGVFSVSCGMEDFQATNVTSIPPDGLPLVAKTSIDAKGRVIPYGIFKVNGNNY